MIVHTIYGRLVFFPDVHVLCFQFSAILTKIYEKKSEISAYEDFPREVLQFSGNFSSIFHFFFIIVGYKCLRSNFKGALRRQHSTLDVMQMFTAVAKRIKLGPGRSDNPPTEKKKIHQASIKKI